MERKIVKLKSNVQNVKPEGGVQNEKGKNCQTKSELPNAPPPPKKVLEKENSSSQKIGKNGSQDMKIQESEDLPNAVKKLKSVQNQ